MSRLPLHRILLTCFLSMTLACGGSGGDDDSGGNGEDGFDWFVDEARGENDNEGTEDAPFESITQALSVATEGDRILVRSGLYDVANLEEFPLVVPEGVTLVGESRDTTIIEGTGNSPVFSFSPDPFVAMVLLSDATVDGFTIRSDRDTGVQIGIHITGSRARLRRSIVREFGPTAASCGIISTSGDRYHFDDNVITENREGINLFLGGAESRLEGNSITNNSGNGIVFQVEPATYDLGGGTRGSDGGNVFSCNGVNDLVARKNTDVHAEDNAWDHVPPTVNVVDTDILALSGSPPDEDAVVRTDGAVLADAPCI